MGEKRATTRGRVAVAAGAAAAAGLLLAAVPAEAKKPDADGMHKVTICHRTNAETNPYVLITVDVASLDGGEKSDHRHHMGPVFEEGMKDAHEKWGDVIPTFTYDGVTYEGNWSGGDGEITSVDQCVRRIQDG
jgi:hypothetical protein